MYTSGAKNTDDGGHFVITETQTEYTAGAKLFKYLNIGRAYLGIYIKILQLSL